MEDIYLCPDCRSEHTEPVDALLGHVARCLTCALLAEALAAENAVHEEFLTGRIAA
jgi:hypothetical protein